MQVNQQQCSCIFQNISFLIPVRHGMKPTEGTYFFVRNYYTTVNTEKASVHANNFFQQNKNAYT